MACNICGKRLHHQCQMITSSGVNKQIDCFRRHLNVTIIQQVNIESCTQTTEHLNLKVIPIDIKTSCHFDLSYLRNIRSLQCYMYRLGL